MNSEDEEKHIQIFKVPQEVNTLEQEFYQLIKEFNQVLAGQLSQMKNARRLFLQKNKSRFVRKISNQLAYSRRERKPN
jgi:hypothetical protein